MKTQAEQYRTLVARLEAIQEAPIPSPGMVQSATNAVTSPDASGSVLRALLTTGMSVVPEIVAFLMKNKSQLSPKCQGVLQQYAPPGAGDQPSARPATPDQQPQSPQVAQPTGPVTGGRPTQSNPPVLIPGQSV